MFEGEVDGVRCFIFGCFKYFVVDFIFFLFGSLFFDFLLLGVRVDELLGNLFSDFMFWGWLSWLGD